MRVDRIARKQIFAWFIVFAMGVFCLLACASDDPAAILPGSPPEIPAYNLMQGITAGDVKGAIPDDKFINATADFSLNLFKKTFSKKNNCLISPASVLLALAMTANGANGNTLTQMTQVLGTGIPIAELNKYFYSFVKGLDSRDKSFLNISNSIWFRENGFIPKREFLQTNADYYNADAFAAPFNEQTVLDINNWINQATNGLVKKMLDSIPPDAVMYLINTVFFDAEWASKYEERNIRNGQFTNINRQVQTAQFMHSTEYKFIRGKGASGFIKPYFYDRYSFVAILPDAGIDIFDFAASLSGEEFLNLVKTAKTARVGAAMPKFDYDFEITMNDALKSMGIQDAFDENNADLLRLGSARGNLFISYVKHKAKITVDESGTKAGAGTVVEIMTRSAEPGADYSVILDCPFIYAIIDNATNLPLFIGAFLSVK